MSTPSNPQKGQTQDLSNEEAKNTSGGSLLGGDDNMLTGVSQGYVNLSQTDEDGETSSTNLDYGSGSLLQNESE